MNEEFLQAIWKHKRLNPNLFTTTGEPIEVLFPGHLNTHAGPDFTEARLRIGSTIWSGQVEIHLRASDWFRHGHHTNPAYKNVILHVVLEHDQDICHHAAQHIPTLSIGNFIDHDFRKRYQRFISEKLRMPCENQLTNMDRLIVSNTLECAVTERLERKVKRIEEMKNKHTLGWEETLCRLIGKYLGVQANSDAFEQLAHSVNLLHLLKHKNNLLQLEALLFGQAGLLEVDCLEHYPNQLRREYKYLKTKLNLQTIDIAWKFLRLRPNHFPTVRIAQLAAMIHQNDHLFSTCLEADGLARLESVFRVTPSEYWQTHYHFGTPSSKSIKKPGRQIIHILIINAIAPLIFLYGKTKHMHKYCDQALHLLQSIPPERNAVIRKWATVGIRAENAFDTQALLELTQQYCAEKKCLSCKIGFSILRNAVSKETNASRNEPEPIETD